MTEPPRGAERIGTTIRGKYRLDGLLGVGGMAVVYLATHRNNRRVAVKMLHPELSLSAAVRGRFLKEGYVANTVDHPGAVAVLDDDVAEDGAAFLVMERLEGDTVQAILEGSEMRLPLDLTLTVAADLLDVLVAAHGKGIVHRDLKPENLFITKDGAVKVLDFGIARLRESMHHDAATATKTGTMIGTPAFMPPEQAMARSNEIDARSDLWAVGATMFTMLTGEFVHEGENGTQIAVAAATQVARSFTTASPDAPPAVVAILDRALAFERDFRWQSATEMRDAVLAARAALCGDRAWRELLATKVHGWVNEKNAHSGLPTAVAAAQRGAADAAIAGTPPLPTSTWQPVASQHMPPGPGSSGPRMAGWVALVAVPSLALGAWLMYQPPPSSPVVPASVSIDSTSGGAPTGSSTPSVAPVASAAPLPPVPAPASPTGVQPTRPAAAVPNSTRPPKPHPASSGHGKAGVNCDPPFSVDAHGFQHYKPGCTN